MTIGLTSVALSFVNLSSLQTILILWFINGFGQGFSHNCAFKITKTISQGKNFAFLYGIMLIGVNVSGSIGPKLSNFVVSNYDWRKWILFSGLMPVLGALISFVFIPNDNSDSRDNNLSDKLTHNNLSVNNINDNNIEKKGKNYKSKQNQLTNSQVANGKSQNLDQLSGAKEQNSGGNSQVENPKSKSHAAQQNAHENGFVNLVLKNELFWMTNLGLFVSYMVRHGLPDWTGIYLSKELGLSDEQIITFLSTFEIGGIFGRLISGYTSDLLMKRSTKTTPELTNENSSQELTSKRFANPRFTSTIIQMTISGLILHIFNFILTSSSNSIVLMITSFLLGATSYGIIMIFTVISSELTQSNQLNSTAMTLAKLASDCKF